MSGKTRMSTRTARWGFQNMMNGEPSRPDSLPSSGNPSSPVPYLLLLACGLCYFAQTFLAWGWPALEGYPQIERWIDPHFLTSEEHTSELQSH